MICNIVNRFPGPADLLEKVFGSNIDILDFFNNAHFASRQLPVRSQEQQRPQ